MRHCIARSLKNKLSVLWYQKNILKYFLAPFSLLYRIIISVRHFLYQKNIVKSYRISAPVIVVGNITVGGTGKTPLVIALVNYLKSHHFNPGVVTRGYGGKSKVWPQVVNHNSDPLLVGDEAVLISQNTKVPVIAGSNRANNAEILVRNFNCNVIVSDDGLQHYALQRDIEIVVIDGMRRFGNKLCLPAGPLREPLSRLTSIDFMVTNGAAHKNEFSMQFVIDGIVSVKNENIKCDIATLRHQKIIAIAGIGNPERFFESLTSLGISFDAIAFPDHHSFQKKDFDHRHADIILMTEKDAVKCRGFADDRFYVAKGRGVVDDAFFKAVLQKLMRWLTQ